MKKFEIKSSGPKTKTFSIQTSDRVKAALDALAKKHGIGTGEVVRLMIEFCLDSMEENEND